MKVILELSDKVLKSLGKKAKEGGRSRKKYMELILTVEATVISNHKSKTNES